MSHMPKVRVSEPIRQLLIVTEVIVPNGSWCKSLAKPQTVCTAGGKVV